MNSEEFAAWESRIKERAQKIWEEKGRPADGPEIFEEQARELLALEEVPDATTRPVETPSNPDEEPILALQNQGDFPGLHDQGADMGRTNDGDPQRTDDKHQ